MAKAKINKDMETRIVVALRRTFVVIASDNHGVPEQDLYAMSGDCYMEMYGNDIEAYKKWENMDADVQEKLLKKAFPEYDSPAYQE